MEEEDSHLNSIRRYLLGQLTDSEREQVEARLLTDDSFFEEVLIAEDELADDYARGALSGAELAGFSQYFLASPERREKVQFAGAFRSYLAATEAEPHVPFAPEAERVPRLRWLSVLRGRGGLALAVPIAAAFVLMAAGGIWLAIRTSRLQSELDRMRAHESANQGRPADFERQLADEQAQTERLRADLQREQDERAKLERQLAELRAEGQAGTGPGSRPPRVSFASLVLTPGQLRAGGEIRKAVLRRGTRVLRLQLQVVTDDQLFRAELQTDEGRVVWSRDNLSATATRLGRSVTLNVPAEQLDANDYQIRLSSRTAEGALEDVGRYYFRVLRQ
jgi:hypothetical protein